ncbi:Ribosomal protein S12 methylthiotransferase RimO [Fundidesulfovibrio magnetotacticus]|uniref:Ribosomal protein uS12 methylthiotransferase RimO n=1 Tax=Fundidesulfovibrio magnetotacticus TaxID=2730080 RepID=A0A6V8LZF2_9BACT|nr:30S ribosomal protein S12 methylthiotransferase RimO [Fundidesulfovibrio magnetotacticus]GFK93605.1 Ribosomal protein S12 methylthiotransferase RimO [Fundidesulfovibrio magnetotacticus]
MKDPIAVHTISLGCPKNLTDTELLLGGLPGPARPVDRPEDARLVLVNTCGFIRPAVEESVAEILDAAQALRGLDPKPLLAVAGCLVSRYGQELRDSLPEVDLWLSTHEIPDWPSRIANALSRAPSVAPKRLLTSPPSYAYLKISEGCRHACRFCTIPSIRGPLKSRPVRDLADEARHLLDSGRSELILVAQDLTAYGRDLGYEPGLRGLLKTLLPLKGLARLRLLYLYPAGLTPGLLDFLKDAGPPLLPYFDIPLQHAHPDVLQSMGRPFAKDPRRVVDLVRDRFPEAAIRTSLIVGYPGETRTHFEYLLRFVRETRFTHLGVFAFQAEEGTPAAKMPRQVGMKTRQARRDAVMAAQAEISEEWLEGFQGRELDVLVDAPHPEWPGLHVGRAWFQAPEIDGVTYVSGPGVKPGAMVRATVDDTKTYDLVALAG